MSLYAIAAPPSSRRPDKYEFCPRIPAPIELAAAVMNTLRKQSGLRESVTLPIAREELRRQQRVTKAEANKQSPAPEDQIPIRLPAFERGVQTIFRTACQTVNKFERAYDRVEATRFRALEHLGVLALAATASAMKAGVIIASATSLAAPSGTSPDPTGMNRIVKLEAASADINSIYGIPVVEGDGIQGGKPVARIDTCPQLPGGTQSQISPSEVRTISNSLREQLNNRVQVTVSCNGKLPDYVPIGKVR